MSLRFTISLKSGLNIIQIPEFIKVKTSAYYGEILKRTRFKGCSCFSIVKCPSSDNFAALGDSVFYFKFDMLQYILINAGITS